MTEQTKLGTFCNCTVYSSSTGRDFTSVAELATHIMKHKLMGLIVSPATVERLKAANIYIKADQ